MLLRFVLFLSLAAVLAGQTRQTVRFKTAFGNIDVQLRPDVAPKTVENFLKYVNKGAYNNSVFHRLVPDFVLQGGGYAVSGDKLTTIAQDAAVVNEYNLSNVRGTIAMAKTDGDPNSATNQWFFNLSNSNALNLNNQNGGFTVFGQIVDAASLKVLDALAAIPVPNNTPLSSPFDQMPLINWTSGTPTAANFVILESITQVTTDPAPVLSDGGIVTATAFGGYTTAAPGSFIEVYGSNLSGDVTRGWSSSDFTSTGGAPTNLENISATIGGQRAFINYVSPTQINMQVPSTVATNITLPVVVTVKGQTSNTLTLPIKARNGGFLAPASFKVGNKQYIYAAKADGSVVSNGTIPGVANNPAKPGETVVLFGIGFGPVTPFSTPYAGQIASAALPLGFPVSMKLGGLNATLLYQGLAPGFVGLYQFNVTIPIGLAAGDALIETTQNGEAIGQTLYLPIAN